MTVPVDNISKSVADLSAELTDLVYALIFQTSLIFIAVIIFCWSAGMSLLLLGPVLFYVVDGVQGQLTVVFVVFHRVRYILW